MQLNNSAYSLLTPEELKNRVFIGKSVINLILAVSLISSMGFWYVLGLDASTSTGFLALISFSIIGLGLASEVVKKVTLSLFRNRTIWLSATFVSILTVAGMLSILDNNKELNLLHSSDGYKEAQTQQKTAFDDAKKWAWASDYSLDLLNDKLIEVTAKRERREISYQSYLAEKRVIQDKIRGVKQYQSALNTQALASRLMVNNSSSVTTSTNPLLSNIANQTGAVYSLLKMVFYLFVTVFLEYAAWFLGGEIEKIENYLRSSKKERLEQMNKAIFGATYEEITQPKKEETALLSNLENVYFLLVNGKKKGGEKMAISAQKFIDSLVIHLEKNHLIEKYAGVEFKAVNKADNTDFAIYKVNRPTLKNEPQKNEPKQVQNQEKVEPKEVQGSQVQEVQNTTKLDTAGEGAGSQVQIYRFKRFNTTGLQAQEVQSSGSEKVLKSSTGSKVSGTESAGLKRASLTPDTGTTGETSNRYNAIKRAIKKGEIKPTLRAIKSFKMDGVGVGDKTAQKFRKALIRDGIIKVK